MKGFVLTYLSLGTSRLSIAPVSLLLVLCSLFFFLSSFLSPAQTFRGRIHYTYQFTDLKGTDLMEGASRKIGREQFYFITDSNYKSLDENNRFTQLYNSSSNIHYEFERNNTAVRRDALLRTSQHYKVTRLNQKEKILGYDCYLMKVESDHSTVVYYVAPALKINPRAFAKHHYGEWTNYLQASEGALSLKQVITNTNAGYIWTITAVGIEPMELANKDFEFPEGYRVVE